MSEHKNLIAITPPQFGTGKELIEIDDTFYCGYCRGTGFFWSSDGKDSMKVKCDRCQGTGQVRATVTVNWESAGEIQPFFRNE